jgi:hypothetical protein
MDVVVVPRAESAVVAGEVVVVAGDSDVGVWSRSADAVDVSPSADFATSVSLPHDAKNELAASATAQTIRTLMVVITSG